MCCVCYHIRRSHDSCCFVTCNVGSHDSCKLHLINLSSKYSGMHAPSLPCMQTYICTHSETISSPDAAALVSLCLHWSEFKVRLQRFKSTWVLFISMEWLFIIGISRLSYHPLHWHDSAVTSFTGNAASLKFTLFLLWRNLWQKWQIYLF